MKLKVDAKMPKGKAPIPKENWKPPSPPNPKLGKAWKKRLQLISIDRKTIVGLEQSLSLNGFHKFSGSEINVRQVLMITHTHTHTLQPGRQYTSDRHTDRERHTHSHRCTNGYNCF